MIRFARSAVLICLLLVGCEGRYDVRNTETGAALYYGTIDSVERVYDGDTIRDVSIRIYPFKSPVSDMQESALTLWPGIEQRPDGIYSISDIRIEGIDAPELRPVQAGRTEASIQREKARAAAATDFLKRLLLENAEGTGPIGFVVLDPEPDKYAGRIVAGLRLVNGDVSIDVAAALLEAGHAVVYDGSTKTHDWGAE